MDASIFDSALSHTRRSDASQKKEKKVACPLLDVFACGQVSNPRLYRLTNFLLGKKVFKKYVSGTVATSYNISSDLNCNDNFATTLIIPFRKCF